MAEDQSLKGMRVAIVATNGVEEIELIEPREALEAAGAETMLVAPHEGEIMSFNHHDKSEPYAIDATLEEVEPTDFDAVYLPGGTLNADSLRLEPGLQRLLQDSDNAGKPIGFMCHAPWALASAGLLEGRNITSFTTLADDMRNAGADWVDEAVVTDANFISSRKPDDLPKFVPALIAHFKQSFGAGQRPV